MIEIGFYASGWKKLFPVGQWREANRQAAVDGVVVIPPAPRMYPLGLPWHSQVVSGSLTFTLICVFQRENLFEGR